MHCITNSTIDIMCEICMIILLTIIITYTFDHVSVCTVITGLSYNDLNPVVEVTEVFTMFLNPRYPILY